MKLRRCLALLSLSSCSLATDPVSLAPEGSTRVLFIGSSLIDAHDLPRTVAQLAISTAGQECYCISIAYQAYELDDHFAQGDARRALSGEEWDFVVLQQGLSALPESRVRLLKGAGDVAKGHKRARSTDGPVHALAGPEPTVRLPCRQGVVAFAADSLGARLAPAGEASLLAWAQDATLPLYGPNGYYPSGMGSYLAALVIFQRIYNRSPVGVQAVAIVNGRSQPWAPTQLLQQAAAEANAAEVGRVQAFRSR